MAIGGLGLALITATLTFLPEPAIADRRPAQAPRTPDASTLHAAELPRTPTTLADKPMKGSRKVLTILLDPQRDQDDDGVLDHPRPSKQKVTKALFGADPSAKGYFQSNSNGQFTIQNVGVTDWYRTNKSGDHYWNDHSGCPDGFRSGHMEKRAEAIRKAAGDVDFKQHDANNDGRLTSDELGILIVMPQQTADGFANRSVVAQQCPTQRPMRVDGVEIEAGIAEWYTGFVKGESAQRRDIVMATEELAHMLLDIGDMYPTPTLPFTSWQNRGRARGYSLATLGPRAFFSHLDAPTKLRLGWLQPKTVLVDGVYTVNAIKQSHDALIVKHPNYPVRNEYFVIANRQSGRFYDWGLPDTGLIIWHVIEGPNLAGRLPANGNWARKGIRLIRENGGQPLTDAQALWDRTSSSSSIRLAWIDPDNPGSGSPSCVTIKDLPASSPSMKVRISVTCQSGGGTNRSGFGLPESVLGARGLQEAIEATHALTKFKEILELTGTQPCGPRMVAGGALCPDPAVFPWAVAQLQDAFPAGAQGSLSRHVGQLFELLSRRPNASEMASELEQLEDEFEADSSLNVTDRNRLAGSVEVVRAVSAFFAPGLSVEGAAPDAATSTGWHAFRFVEDPTALAERAHFAVPAEMALRGFWTTLASLDPQDDRAALAFSSAEYGAALGALAEIRRVRRNANGAPTLAAIDPETGRPGTTVQANITGRHLEAARNLAFGPGVTVDAFEVVGPSRVTAIIRIAAQAEPGPRDVEVTTPTGTATLTDGFAVQGTAAEPPNADVALVEYDRNANCRLDNPELLTLIDDWSAGNVANSRFLDGVDAWANQSDICRGESASQSLRLTAVRAQTRAAGTAIAFQAVGRGMATMQVSVYTLAGEPVWSRQTTGSTLSWDLTTSQGRPVPNGVYLYRVTVADSSSEPHQSPIRKLVVLR